MVREPPYEELRTENLILKQAAEALGWYKQIFNASTDHMALLDTNYRYILVNDTYVESQGRKREQIVGHTVSELFGEDLFERKQKPMIDRCLNGETVRYQTWIEFRDRGRRFMDVTHTPYSDEDGVISGYVVNARDLTDQKVSEAALSDSEKKYASLAGNLNVGVYRNTVGSKGRFIEANPAVVEMFGFDNREEFLKTSVSDLYKNPDDRDQYNTKILEKGELRNEELQLQKKDGTLFIGSVSAVVVRDGEGEVKYYDGIIEDITERKESEEEVQKLASVVRHSGELVNLSTLRGQMIFLNEAGGEMLGIDPDEVENANIMDVIPENLVELVQSELLPTLMRGETWEGDLQYRNIRTGELTDVYATTFTINEPNTAHPSLLANVSLNITDRKRAEEALRESEAQYRNIFESFQDLYFRSDLEGVVEVISPSVEPLAGYGSDELIGRSVLDVFVRPSDRDEFMEILLASGTISNYELELKKKTGEIAIVSLNAHIVNGPSGKPVAVEGVMREITDQRRAEEENRRLEDRLLRSRKMEAVGLLAGGVAHDLNNVLSGIVGYPELILMGLPESSKLRKPIETMQASGHRAAAIVEDLLTVTRGAAIAKQPSNLNDIVNDYLRSPEFRQLGQFHPGARVKTSLDTGLLNVYGSHIHIRKAVMNLLSNASEAIEGNGTITISSTNRYVDRPLRGYDDIRVGEYALLSVSDDGPGISPDDLERIFEPFYSKKVMGRSGTGLGLAVVWNVVQDHKGYIDVTTDRHGTKFDLYFPITRDEMLVRDLPTLTGELNGHGEMILVVDDVESQRDLSCRMLEALGYRAETVSSGEDAVEYLKAHAVDLVLLDMIMDPGISGREAYGRIVEIHPKQKAVIVSGFAESDDVKETQKLGAGAYVRKPFTLEEIGLAVKEELGSLAANKPKGEEDEQK